MANRHRGEVDLALAGETITLRLTLGALAEVEAAFGATDLAALGERLGQGRLSAADLIRFLAAAVRGAGNKMTDRDFADRVSASDLPACITALHQLFALTFGDGE